MFQSLGNAAAALRHQQTRLDTVAHNISNINTVAFKSSRKDFQTALYATGHTPGPARTPDGNQQRGHGTVLAGITMDFRQGFIQVTGINLDFALQGEGFFSVGDLDGNVFYTRNGNFMISAEAGGNFLVNGEGLYVLDPNGMRIQVPDNTRSIDVGIDGAINFALTTGENISSALGVFTFRNLKGLESAGGSLFVATEASGGRTVPAGTIVRQGALEGSNVELAEEMTRMIRAQRAFQLASRALSTADEMEGIASQMRR
jgi:flagellar basal-body rod protein FlgG